MALFTRFANETVSIRAIEGHTFVAGPIKNRFLSQTIDVSDFPVRVTKRLTRRLSQVIDVNDPGIRRTFVVTKGINVRPSWTDSVTRSVRFVYVVRKSDSIDVSDALSAALQAGTTTVRLSQMIVVTDTPRRIFSASKDLPEVGISFSDAVDAGIIGTTYSRLFSDSFVVDDDLIFSVVGSTFNRFLSQNLSVTDNLRRSFRTTLEIGVTAAFSDVPPPPPVSVLSNTIVWRRTFFGGLAAKPAYPTRFFVLPFVRIETGLNRRPSDSISVTDQLVRIWNPERDFLKNIQITDQVVAFIEGAAIEVSAQAVIWKRTFLNGMAAKPAYPFRHFLLPITRAFGAPKAERFADETFVIGVDPITIMEASRYPTDDILVVDDLFRQVVAEVDVPVTVETIDELDLSNEYERLSDESVSIRAIIEQFRNLFRELSDDIPVMDVFIVQYLKNSVLPGSILKLHLDGRSESVFLYAGKVTPGRASKSNVVRVPAGKDVIQGSGSQAKRWDVAGLLLGDESDRDAMAAALEAFAVADRDLEILFYLYFNLQERFVGRMEGYTIERLRRGVYIVRMTVAERSP